MAHALTAEQLHNLNEKLGKEETKKLELAGKADPSGVEARLEGKINSLRQETQTIKVELGG